jgi:hypothetical protein
VTAQSAANAGVIAIDEKLNIDMQSAAAVLKRSALYME